ncbi:hypothetical protein L2E82_06088 [Cichorium intybus]|uniref:Uncharacterized protein n=1 Tax=Cichorium intybus TaxID=13427 RepID=A0ACB9HAK7_CICIN|nr:hypothetical protein L2E82_06088 [Cichorium intybus]
MTGKKMNHPNGDAEWKVVDRRKNDRRDHPTSFYVSNLPEGATVNEIWKKFEGFGKLVDVYIARKKERSGARFGFVRFAGVQDAKAMEESFASAWNLRGSKTFANVVSGIQSSVNNNNLNPVKVNISQDLDKLLFDNFLLGEAIDYETLKSLPNMFNDEGVIFGELYFIGGLCTLIGFDDVESTTGLLENKECWEKWFKWLKKGDSNLYWKYERMVDMKIIGLPIQLRTPENISKILNRYGKVLSVDEDVWKFTDLSSCEGHILTESRTRINDEIVIEFGQGKFMKIGIIELKVNLAPFEAGEIWGENNNDINDENDSSDDDEDNDNNNDAYDSASDMEGMSDTWNNNAKDEQEEGEIHDDEQMNVKEHSCGSPTDNNEVLEAVESVANADDAGLENMLEDDIVAESQFNPRADKRGDTNDVLIDDQGPVIRM